MVAQPQQVTIVLRKNSSNVIVNHSLRMYGFNNVCSSATKTANHQPILEKGERLFWRIMGRGSGSISLDPSNGHEERCGWGRDGDRPVKEEALHGSSGRISGCGGLAECGWRARRGQERESLVGVLGRGGSGHKHGALPASSAIVPPLSPCRGLFTGETLSGSSTPWMQQGLARIGQSVRVLVPVYPPQVGPFQEAVGGQHSTEAAAAASIHVAQTHSTL